MRENGLRAKSARKYKAKTDLKHNLPVPPELLERQFSAERPDAAWVKRSVEDKRLTTR